MTPDTAKVEMMFRQMMRVLEKHNATTEEGFCAMLTCLKTVVENEALSIFDRRELKKKIRDSMEEKAPFQLITPESNN
jgi:hypothetical protein